MFYRHAVLACTIATVFAGEFVIVAMAGSDVAGPTRPNPRAAVRRPHISLSVASIGDQIYAFCVLQGSFPNGALRKTGVPCLISGSRTTAPAMFLSSRNPPKESRPTPHPDFR